MKAFLVLTCMTAACLVVAGVAAGTPGNGADRVPIGNQPFDVPASACGFPIHVGIVSDKEYIIHSTTLTDGTSIFHVTGKLVESFTNTDTGKSITKNISGPGTLTFYPDGTSQFEGTGNGDLFFGPLGQANTGEPGLVFMSGHVVAFFSASGPAESFKLSGNQTNGCALLAA